MQAPKTPSADAVLLAEAELSANVVDVAEHGAAMQRVAALEAVALGGSAGTSRAIALERAIPAAAHVEIVGANRPHRYGGRLAAPEHGGGRKRGACSPRPPRVSAGAKEDRARDNSGRGVTRLWLPPLRLLLPSRRWWQNHSDQAHV